MFDPVPPLAVMFLGDQDGLKTAQRPGTLDERRATKVAGTHPKGAGEILTDCQEI
jgi:hypothetical protein